MTEQLKALTEFEFGVKISQEVEDLLKEQGYERRSGSCTYRHNYYTIVPLKKWYYPVEYYSGILIDVEEEVTVRQRLKVKLPKK